MADDAERAAKAARAKAMLKKRQQQKTGVSPSPSPAPGASRPSLAAQSPSAELPAFYSGQMSPARSPPPPHQDASVLFGHADKNDIDFGEFGVLTPGRGPVSPPLVKSPPASSSQPPLSPHNGDANNAPNELRTLVVNQQQTISLLVNEKVSLAAQLDQLEDFESKRAENEQLLAQERKRADNLAERLRHSEDHARTTTTRLEEAEHREREITEKSREQDRELEHTRRSAGELKTQLESRDRELRALKEQVEADDRVETLERSLQATQDRAEELEFQLAKVKQNHTASTHERDTLTQQLGELTASEAEWTRKHSVLEQDFASAQHELTALSSSLEAAERARTDLEGQLATSDTSLTAIQQQIAHASSELAAHARHLHAADADAATAERRADDAEQAQRSLQAENSGLLAQLEEVRPKVVALSNKGAEDEERIWEAEKRVREGEAAIARLEAEVDARTAAEEEAKERVKVIEAERSRDEKKLMKDLLDVKEAYNSLARDLAHTKERATKLEEENSEQRTALIANEREQEHWRTQAEAREAEAEAARSELSAHRQTEDDTLAVVEHAQAEVEALRDQLALREDELARLREGTEAPTSTSSSRPASPRHARQPSLNDEMLSAARQQHALDLSTAHSRIRALETDVFDAQASAHAAQKRVTALEDELAQLRTTPPDTRLRSPPPPLFPRGSSFHGGSDDSRRPSLSSTRPHTPSTLALRPLIAARAVYDENLSAATRHKRKVSLSMLKARIESERAAAQHTALVGSPLARGMALAIAEADEAAGMQTPRTASDGRPRSVLSDAHSHRTGLGGRGGRAPQFMDESHVFWCHSCRGDLVVL